MPDVVKFISSPGEYIAPETVELAAQTRDPENLRGRLRRASALAEHWKFRIPRPYQTKAEMRLFVGLYDFFRRRSCLDSLPVGATTYC
jgi:hypothetical protein